MAECVNCKTWNPDDKMVCWRCQTPLPRPKSPQPKRRMSYITLSWLIVALFLIGWLFFQLFILNPVGR